MKRELSERILDLRLKGYCCSQIIMGLGLEDLEKENPDLIAAMGGFCNGLDEGKLCGTLAAGVALLYMVNPKEASKSLRATFMDWFYDRFGGYDCDEILGGDYANKMRICPIMVEESYEMLQELLDL